MQKQVLVYIVKVAFDIGINYMQPCSLYSSSLSIAYRIACVMPSCSISSYPHILKILYILTIYSGAYSVGKTACNALFMFCLFSILTSDFYHGFTSAFPFGYTSAYLCRLRQEPSQTSSGHLYHLSFIPALITPISLTCYYDPQAIFELLRYYGGSMLINATSGSYIIPD